MASFIDLQVNGYAGVDFQSDELDPGQLHKAAAAMETDGVVSALATFTTERLEAMQRRIGRLASMREADPLVKRVLAGVHIEGPFLNGQDGYRGAHPADAISRATPETMTRLLEAGAGLTRIVTLAPEQDPGGAVTRLLADQKILVSAGHCNPSLDQLDAAIESGLSLFTHLGNGCPRQLERHENVIQRVLSRAEHLHLGFIADGIHVPLFALGNYLRAAGTNRCFVVSDAMAAAGLGPGTYRLGRWQVEVDKQGAAWAPGREHLLGSALPMKQAAANLRDQLNLPVATVEHLTHDLPQTLITPTT